MPKSARPAHEPSEDRTAHKGSGDRTSTHAAPAGGSCAHCGSTGSGAAIEVVVTASLETLTGLSNDPGTVNGDPVHSAIVRDLALRAGWLRTGTLDSRGVLVDLGPQAPTRRRHPEDRRPRPRPALRLPRLPRGR